MESLPALALAHLVLWLRPINRALYAAVENQKAAAARLARPELPSLCISEEHVESLLEQVDAAQREAFHRGAPALPSPAELGAEEDLRAQCSAIGATLPLDRLSRTLQLTPFEREAVLLCAAPELDRSYERIYAFILDDLNRRFPCIELLVSLTAECLEEQVVRRHALARSGRLRRSRVLLACGDPPTELRQEVRLAPEVFDFLTGARLDIECLCRDPAEIAVPAAIEPPPQIGEDEFRQLVDALGTGRVRTLGIWGPLRNGGEELVIALATATQRLLRRISVIDLEQGGADPAQILDDQIKRTSALQACLWVEADMLGDPGRERIQRLLAEALAEVPIPVLLTGEHPWRPSSLLRSGTYAEVELAPPAFQAREQLWSGSLPELERDEIERLAARFSLSGADIRAISRLARTRARLLGNGKAEPVRDHITAACAIVTRRTTSHFTTLVRPRRGLGDLVLPANLHRQIVEVATFFQLRSRVDEEWGFGRLANGSGMKALFVGEPGTGKTLAAEVIAGQLGLVLYKVDLARVTSKWVGETEKNLEGAFREAEESHAVLFFDEADALFGKRGEVQHGTDRYANLEVSYLLQRLENSNGLVILASNVKDQIDVAFVRRFHAVIHFPRPGLAERCRIWRLAMPGSAPVATGVEFEALAKLEMTGAAIVNAARTAALIAADSGSPAITMAHLVHATARQFRRESRVLTPSELGRHGALLQEAL